jgi:hypothetical protein
MATLAMALPAAPALAASQSATNLQKMLEYNNAERGARGIRALSRDSRLDAEAGRWAEKLAAEGKMYHRPSTYALSVGFRSGGENLAWHDDSLSASQAHNMWMDSSTHRRNMLDPAFNAAGFGIACSTKSGKAYVIAVVEFGGDAPPARSTPPASPHVAGGQSLTGVGCSGGDDSQAPPPPPPATLKSPASVSSPTASPGAANPAAANLQAKKASTPTPTVAIKHTTPPASPAAVTMTKPTTTPPTKASGQGSENLTAQGSAPVQAPLAESDQPDSGTGAGEAELTAARSATTRTNPGRLMVTVLAAGLAYLFLLRVVGIKRPRRRYYSPRHSSR